MSIEIGKFFRVEIGDPVKKVSNRPYRHITAYPGFYSITVSDTVEVSKRRLVVGGVLNFPLPPKIEVVGIPTNRIGQ